MFILQASSTRENDPLILMGISTEVRSSNREDEVDGLDLYPYTVGLICQIHGSLQLLNSAGTTSSTRPQTQLLQPSTMMSEQFQPALQLKGEIMDLEFTIDTDHRSVVLGTTLDPRTP